MAEDADASKQPKLVVLYGTLPLKPRKAANSSISSSDSMNIIDSDLNIGLAANTSYIVDSTILVEASSSAPDLKIKFIAPSDAEVDLGYSSVSGSNQGVVANNQTSSTIDLVGNTPTVVHISGTVKTGATAGALEFRWGQATSDSGLLAILRGSYLRADAL